MTQLFSSPNQQFVVGATGAVASGYFLYFYLSGTNTPLNTYSDIALTVPNTNPITLDSNGNAGIIFLQQALYKVVLTDPTNVVVWTCDPVPGTSSLFNTVFTPAPTTPNVGWIDESGGTLRYWSNGSNSATYGVHQFLVNQSGASPNTATALTIADDSVIFGQSQAWKIDSPNGRGIFRYTGSGNVAIIQNISGVSSYDSALSFNDGQTGLHSGDGIEHGALGWHQGSEFPFSNSFFLEASNDPESGITTNPPSPFKIIQTGFVNSFYASRTRFSMNSDGTMQFFDASSIGITDGVSIMTMPILAATGIGMNILSVGGSGTPSKTASFMAVGLVGAGTNAFAADFFGASDTNLNNGIFLGLHGTRTTDTTYKLFDYADTDGAGTTLWRVFANGDTYNKNGVYGTLSDEREKIKSGDMPSTVDIIRQIEFGKFQYISDGENAPYRFGPYAQQIQSVVSDQSLSSFLVSTLHIDDEGTERLWVNNTALQMLASKALQETILRIDDIEAKLKAL